MADLEAAANFDLENLRKWLIANKLRLNVAKAEFILIGSKPLKKILIRIQMFSSKISKLNEFINVNSQTKNRPTPILEK